MKRVYGVVLAFAILSAAITIAGEGGGVGANQAVELLKGGNSRYVQGHSIHPDQTAKHRKEIASVQKPFAVILGCADSRVPPEVIFDQGLGDLFVLRVAGNMIDDAVVGSIEYAVEHLGAKLVVVLGHERCGAVKATVDGGEAPGHIGALVKAIKPAVDKVRAAKGDVVENSVRANAVMVTEQLRSSKPILEEMVKEGKIKIVAARYDLDEGMVEFLK
jgi:carbonic anhydrase